MGVPDRFADSTHPGNRARTEAREVYWDGVDKDSHPCQRCSDTDPPLEVHHLDGDEFNNDPDNLVALCHECHNKAHRREALEESLAEWKSNFLSIGE